MTRRLLLLLAAAALCLSCDQTEKPTMASDERPSFKLAMPDAEFALTAAERASVRERFDPNALTEFLAHVHPQYRKQIFQQFQRAEEGGKPGAITKVSDAQMQAILDRVWAPYWANIEPEQVQGPDLTLPGGKDAADGKLYRPSASSGKPNHPTN